MKYLSKLLSMLLVGAMLYSTGCTDYETDIKNLEDKVDKIEQDLKTDYDGKINSLSANLTETKEALEALIESEIAALTAEHDADIKALEDAYKKADSALEQSLQGKIDAANAAILALQGELDEEVAALETEIAALETALAQAKKEAQDADAALKAELLKEITNLETELLAKITELQTKLEGDIKALRDDMQAKVDAANDAITKAQGEIDALDIRVGKTETDIQAINTEIDDLNNLLTVAKAELEAADAKLAKDLADAKAELAKAIADGDAALAASLEKAISDLTAQNEALKNSLEAQIAALESQLNAKIEQLEAQDLLFVQQIAALASDLSALEDLVDARYEELVASLATLETKLQAQIDQNKRDIAQNAANIDKVVNDLAETKSDLAKLTNSVANLEILLVKNYEEFTNFKAIMEGQIAALQASLVLLQSSYDEIVNELIPGLNEQISKNEELINSTIADLAKNEAIFNAYREATNNTLDLLMKTDAALQTVLSSVCDDVDLLQGELVALTSAVADVQAACQEQLANCYAYINEVAADLGSKYNSLASMQAAQQAQMEMIFAKMTAYEAYFTSINENLQKEIDERKSEDRRISVALTELASKYDELDAKYDARCNELAANIVDLATDFAEYKVQVEHALDALLLVLRQEIADALNSANEYTDEKIEMLDAKLTEKLNQAVIDLNTRITGVETELKALVEKTEAQLRQEMNDIKYDLNNEVQALLERIVSAEGRLDGAEGRLDEAEGRITLAEEKIKENFEFFLAEVNSIRAELTNINTRIDNVNNSLDTLRKAFEDFVTKTETALETLSDDLTDLIINQIPALRDNLQAQIDEIVNRVQSLVFVPKYTDGKGTINYATAGGAIVESRSEAEYQVYPASCANAIVSAFKPEAEQPILTFDHEYLETRSTANPFKIVAVKEGSKDGRIIVTFESRGLDKNFYTDRQAKTEYALSLHLNTTKVNISSPYTNFVRTTKPEKITMAIYDGEKELSSRFYTNEHKFRYNETGTTVEILPNHVLKYTVGGKTYTEAELNAAGYALTSKREEFVNRVGEISADDIDPFKYELVEGIYNVSVGVVDYKWIGYPVVFGYRYVAGGLTTSAYDYCVTTPTQAAVKIADQTATWTYSKDVYVDADRFNKKNELSYKRLFPVDLANVDENLPKGEGNPSILEVFKWNPYFLDVKTTVKVLNGDQYEVVKGVDAQYIVTEKDEVMLAFSGFEFGEKYFVETAYTLKKASFFSAIPFLEVTFSTNIETVDRNRDEVKVAYEPTLVDFVSNLTLLEGQISDKATDLYYQLKADAIDAETNYDIDEKDYLDNNLNKDKETYTSTQDFIAYGVNADEILTRDEVIENNGGWVATGLALNQNPDTKERTIVTNYYYDEFDFVPASIKFEKTFTTWYGQKFIVTKTLNFDFTEVNKMFDFKHNEYRVFENPYYYSQVQPEYTWDEALGEPVLFSYDVRKVDLLEAFYVVDAKGNKIAYSDLANYPTYNMAYEFVLEAKYQGITMEDDFKIKYYGSEDYVDVMGKLYVVNSNGAKYQLPTSFDEGGDYADYYVQKFNPIGKPHTTPAVVDVMNSDTYTVNVFNQIKMKDFRSNGRECYPIIANGAWVVGDGKNGFYANKDVREIYGISWDWEVIDTDVPADVEVKFEESTGELTFKNNQQIALTKEFTVPVKLYIYNIWSVEYSQEPITVNVTFKPVPVQ